MYFLIEDDDWLEKYDTIWEKVRADIKKKFDSELVYIKNCLIGFCSQKRRELLSLSIFKRM